MTRYAIHTIRGYVTAIHTFAAPFSGVPLVHEVTYTMRAAHALTWPTMTEAILEANRYDVTDFTAEPLERP